MVTPPPETTEVAPVTDVAPDAWAAEPLDFADEALPLLRVIEESLERIEADLQRLAALGLDDPAAGALRRSIDRRRDEILEARDRLARLGHPLPIARLDFVDPAERGVETVTPGLPLLVLRNTGEGPLQVRSIAVIGDRPADVLLGDGCSGTTLQPGEDCVIEPRFDPAELQLAWAELELNHDGQQGEYSLPLPGAAPAMAAMRDDDDDTDSFVGEPTGTDRSGEEVATVTPHPPPPTPPPPSIPPPPPQESTPAGGEDTATDPGPPPPDEDDREATPADGDSGPGPGKEAEAAASDNTLTLGFAILGALLLALIVAAAVFVASPSEFQFKVFNTTLAAGAALVVAAVVRAAGLPERASEAAGTRFAGFFAQGGSALMTFVMVYLGQPLQRLGLGSAGAAAGPAPAALAPVDPVAPPPRSIFISYRRSGTADVTGRIYEHLVQRYGDEAVFKDVEDITLGVDFRQALSAALGECRVVLAVLGPEWASHTDSEGRRRLDDPSDFVRVEIETALGRGIPLIPLLVQGASIPPPEELPASLEGLAFRNGMPVRPDPDFANDMRRLIADIDKILARGSGIWKPEPGT